jgi:C-terminal processing protease CtpA/Prc
MRVALGASSWASRSSVKRGTTVQNSLFFSSPHNAPPAERAGLRPCDRIVAVDGQDLKNLRPFYGAIIAGHKAAIDLTVEERGSAGGQRVLRVVVGGGKRVPQRTMRLADLLGLPLDYYPLAARR